MTRLFISINLVLCVSASFISIHPIIKSGGLLRSAVVTSFCMYLTWSALNYNPNENCNPSAYVLDIDEWIPSRDIVPTTDLFFLVISLIYFTFRIEHIIANLKDMIPLYIFTCRSEVAKEESELSTAVISTMNEQYQANDAELIEKWLEDCDKIPPDSPLSKIPPDSPLSNQITPFRERLLFGFYCYQEHADAHRTTNDSLEKIPVVYSYSWMHFVYCIATSSAFILLTHWLDHIPGSRFKASIHFATMSVKMIAGSTSVLVYIWSLVTPVLENMYSNKS